MSTLSGEFEHTIWVVAKQYDDGSYELGEAQVEEKGFWDKDRALARAKHINEQDKNVSASVWPVRFWASGLSVTSDNVPPPVLVMGAVTQGGGQQLIAYAEQSHPRLRLPQPMTTWYYGQPLSAPSSEPPLSTALTSTWNAWLEGQAAQGNFDEAALGGPSIESLQAICQETPAASVALAEAPPPGPAAPARS